MPDTKWEHPEEDIEDTLVSESTLNVNPAQGLDRKKRPQPFNDEIMTSVSSPYSSVDDMDKHFLERLLKIRNKKTLFKKTQWESNIHRDS